MQYYLNENSWLVCESETAQYGTFKVGHGACDPMNSVTNPIIVWARGGGGGLVAGFYPDGSQSTVISFIVSVQ